jgi:hypothetical protein
VRFKITLLTMVAALTVATLAPATQILQYDFNGNLNPNPSFGLYPLTPGGSASVLGPDRFGVQNSALFIAGPGASYLDMTVNDDTPQRTVCFWFNAISVAGSNIGMIYESDGPAIANGQTQFGVVNNSMDYMLGNNHVSSPPIVAGRWYFAAIVRSATDIKYYLNCILVATRTDMSNGHSLNNGQNTWMGTGRIGNTSENRPNAPPAIYNYYGFLDEFRIYNNALTAAQLASVMGAETLTPSLTMASSFCAGAPITADGTASQGAPLDEDHYYWEITESDQFGNIASGAQTWNHWYAGTAGTFMFPSSTGGGPAFLTCGRYYKVKLAIQNCMVPWAETAKIVHIICNPNVTITGPQYVCGTSVTTIYASVGSGAITYHWSPGNQNTSAIDVHPATDCTPNCSTGTSTYTVTATNSAGCSSTANITIIAAPQNLNLDLSTGVDASSNIIANGSPDPFWKIRGRANSTVGYTTPFANLSNTTVVAPYQTTNWASTPGASWVTSEAIGAQPNPNAPFGNWAYANMPQFWYWYERRFVIPPVGYLNFKLNIAELTVDNFGGVYLNTPNTLTGGSPGADVWVDQLPNHDTFHYLFGPFTIANQAKFLVGQNILQAGIYNAQSSSYTPTGLLMRANLTATCQVQTVPCHHCL